MPTCKVWNDNAYLYEEKFKGEQIVIEPRGYVEMDLDEAHQFLGTFKPIVKRGDGTADPRCFKMLRIDSPKVEAQPNPLMCHANGAIAGSQEELAKMIVGFSHLAIKDKAEEKLAAENAELRAELAKSREEMAEIREMLHQALPKRRKKDVEPHPAEEEAVEA